MSQQKRPGDQKLAKPAKKSRREVSATPSISTQARNFIPFGKESPSDTVNAILTEESSGVSFYEFVNVKAASLFTDDKLEVLPAHVNY